MRHPFVDYLEGLLGSLEHVTEGDVARYIPILAEADPSLSAVAVATTSGRVHTAGDADAEFSIQSVSKPFTYAGALEDRGVELVDEYVALNPSGEAFNELSLEADSHRPDNAMINAGAIAVHQLLVGPGATPAERTERAVSLMSTLAGRRLRVDERTFESEMATADRNLALGHMLRSHGILQDQAEDVVAGYIAQCSVMVTVRDLAVMGATLASGGLHPLTGERVLSSLVCRQVLSVMSSSGMYDAAGQWMAHVGIPAKSGVSGAVLGALPGQVGIGTYSPRLDPFGNSVRGVEMCRIMSEDLDLHIMEADVIGSTVVRSVRREGDTVHLHLQGVIRFGGGESVLAAMTELGTGADPDPVEWAHCFYPFSEEPDTAAGRAAAQDEGRTAAEALEQEAPVRAVVVHLDRVDRVAPVGRRLIEDGLKRLRADGVQVRVEDPDGVLTGG